MPVCAHRCLIGFGENPMQFPNSEDQRVQPFFENLKRLGVMNNDGIITKPCVRIRRGIGPGGLFGCYIWRADWDES